MKVIPLDAFRDKIPLGVAVQAVERGFRALALGQATLPDPMVVELKDLSAEIHVKGAHITGARYIVLKLATGFYDNPRRGLPSGDGLFLLLNAETGAPELLLAEHGYLTDLRTAAAVGLTLKYFAPRGVKAALLVGAGAVGRLSARMVVTQLPVERLTIWNRSAERAEKLARELNDSGTVKARVAAHLESEVRKHRAIVTATASTTPLIKAAWVAKGTHITSVGTGSPEKVELEPALLAKATKVVADRVAQTVRYGNLHHAALAGTFTADQMYGELGDVAAARLAGREDDDEITIADLTGVGVQDAAIAQAVVEALGL
jgi:ornithine cyclodeaminase/alanine dehydrogenase-like protein (mu-crystallin family)